MTKDILMENLRKIIRISFPKYEFEKLVDNILIHWKQDFCKRLIDKVDRIQHHCASLEICRKDEVVKIIEEMYAEDRI